MTANTNAPSRKSWLWLAVSAFLIALLAVAAACSSSDDEDVDDGGGNGDNGSPTATADATADANGDGNGDGDGGDGGGDGDSLADRLRELSDDYEIVEAKVVFNFTSSGGGEVDFDTQMTLISRPPSDTRMEFSTDEGTVIVISTSDASYTCFSGGGEESCFSLPADDSDPDTLPFFGDFTDVDEIRDVIDAEANVDIDEFDDKIAGEDVNCFRATGDIDGEDGVTAWCFTDDGILLFSSFTGTVAGVESSFEMRATSFDRDVSDSDFEPPYDTLDLGDLGDIGDLFD